MKFNRDKHIPFLIFIILPIILYVVLNIFSIVFGEDRSKLDYFAEILFMIVFVIVIFIVIFSHFIKKKNEKKLDKLQVFVYRFSILTLIIQTILLIWIINSVSTDLLGSANTFFLFYLFSIIFLNIPGFSGWIIVKIREFKIK